MTIPGEPTRILRSIGRRLHHIHLHDFADDKDHHPPFEGDIQWVEIFRGLREIDYRGAFMFEPAPPYARPTDDSPDHPPPSLANCAPVLRKVGAVPEHIVALASGT